MTTIGLVGLGLIGGSLGLDLRSQGLEVLGVSRKETTCQIAKERGAVTEASVNLEILNRADIIFICTPIASIISTLELLLPYLNPETIITDVGSVKAPIVKKCSQLWGNFVGGHPMAGTADQGIEAAQYELFVNAPYVITPLKTTPPEAVKKIEDIARSLKSVVYSCSPAQHDQAVAWISHLPVMVSASLIDGCMKEKDLEILTLAKNLASSGFRDTSRVGGGNPELGVMMARYNTDSLLRSLKQYRKSLDQIIDVIKDEKWEKLAKILTNTQEARTEFTENKINKSQEQ
ncbi:Prephenate dehydrogenase [Gloeothece citriformis PCC 7424]|uniref:Prephenate dehydrogenase n=1 Tax=Gloeothece citriformis (strain PCC 7424) TaxID=65393 RepID=B7KEZ3_GLOC7|nr:prephenate/arogenate dehydrogenase [Gloeothece citriformis]ACK70449.1 Prephenate dehydrogenase [Gloeothece citriformis PCC 7424]